jgi:ABC-type transport system involved in multi-copper enzyme maturation permease subunit
MSPAWIHPLWQVGVGVLAAVAAMMIVGAILRQLVPKVAAIARVTAKEALSQPLFYVLLTIGVFGLILFPFIPYNTLGEDIKMVKDEGLTLIMVLSVILALWTASVSIADEIEGKTALTLLSKPVGRRQFILGKFVGILTPVAIMFIVLGAVFLASVSFKAVYDSRETGSPEPTAEQCQEEMLQIAPGLALSLMETVVLASISVAISTRLPMMANLVICAAIYVLGHLVPILANSAVGKNEYVKFIADLQAAIFPVLDYFNISAGISTYTAGQRVPWDYIAWDGLYCVLYSTVAMLFALLLFEDRDLA